MEKYDYYHILPSKQGKGFTVKGYDTYPSHSVLAGQTRISFLDSFDTLEEAQKAFPEAELSNEFMEPVNTFNHLSNDSDY